MTIPHIVLATALVLPLSVSRPLHASQPAPDQLEARRLFSERMEDYARLHRRLEGPLPALTPARQPLENYLARQVLATAIRKARATATQGDMFTPPVAVLFRTLIAEALTGRDVEALLGELTEEDAGVEHAHLVVNEPLPRGASHEMPCVLLRTLPALPEDVEYRIVGRHLVLWDTHANLVIDFLPDALAPTRWSDGSYGTHRVAASGCRGETTAGAELSVTR